MAGQRLRHGAGGAAVQAISDGLTNTACLDDALASQNCQMLRHERPPQIKIRS